MGNRNTKNSTETAKPNYDQFISAGHDCLKRKKLNDAEAMFAAALKLVHNQEGRVYEEAAALKALGYVYKERGRLYSSGEDFVKSSGLFISTFTRLQRCSKDEVNHKEAQLSQLQQEIEDVHALFIKEILRPKQRDALSNDYHKVKHYKATLNDIRNICRVKVKLIDEMPPVDPDRRDIAVENKRVENIQHMYADIGESMKKFVGCMIDDCVQMMAHPPPCRYSVLGLGSTAREEATPYSDLEFCILVEEETPKVMNYFTNLTNFLHLKVVELGETILPSLGIQSLNNYHSGEPDDDWFYDNGPRGFSFDGAMPWASKVPTGRGKTVAKPWMEPLIKTPENMASLLSETSALREGYRLADVLSTCVLICGDQSLFEAYSLCKKEFDFDDDIIATSLESCDKISDDRKQKILQELVEVEKQYHTSLSNYIRKTGGSYTVKKDFYRFPSLVVEYLGRYYNIESTSSWTTIDKLESAHCISSDGAHDLRVTLAIAAELRLRAYLDNQSQNEYFNDIIALVAKEDAPKDLAMMLQRYFFTVVPLEKLIKEAAEKGNLLHLKDTNLYDNNPKIKAQMYCQFQQYYKAVEILEGVIAQDLQPSLNNNGAERDLAEICKILGNALAGLEYWSASIKYHGIAMEINETLYQSNSTRTNVKTYGDSCLNYGVCLCALGKKQEALPFLSKALEVRRSFLNSCSTTLEKVASLEDLVDAYSNLSKVFSSPFSNQVSMFFHYNNEAMSVCKILLEEHGTAYYRYPTLYFDQGLVYYDLRKYGESAKAYEKSLELFYKYKKYDLNTDGEAGILNNFGNTLIALKDLDRARSLHSRAYEIRRKIHGGRDHNSVARSLNNFGLISEVEGNFKEAREFYILARDMSERIHGADSSYEHLQMYRRNVARVEKML
jgi:tetratricopeptide (TPR) repeat protein